MSGHEVYTCQWPDCVEEATKQIWGENGLEYIWVCSAHRAAVLASLEYENTLCPEKAATESQQREMVPRATAVEREVPKDVPSEEVMHDRYIVSQAEAGAMPIDDWIEKKRKTLQERLRP